MNDRKTWVVVVGIGALIAMGSLPGSALPSPPSEDPYQRIDDLLTCIVKTTGTLVGYYEPLSTEEKINQLHVVNDEHPHRAIGLFEYQGQFDTYHRYMILSGYANGADWCEGPVDDLIGDFATTV